MNDILIVEDEKSISNLIRLSLSKAGYKCACVFDGVTAADLLENNRYDLVLLDIMLPGFDGLTLMEYIRPMEIPVIFITAKGSVEDRIKGLRAGAEDYIVKPFDIAELLVRIEVVLRRYNKLDSIINICSVTIDPYSRLVKKDGKEIHLTPKEYDLLLLFIRNPNRAMYREAIYERVWGEEFLYGSKTVDLHIQRLRKKLGWEQHIQAINKIGYRFEV
ncbi:MAG: response regulator transcription factor [Eubacterium sp.]|nr:response regulator transcription factor [Eubacterium sp.]